MSSWTYDVDADALYINLRNGQVARQIEVSSTVVADVAADGAPIGVEVLNASAGLAVEEIASRLALNEIETMLLESVEYIGLARPRLAVRSATSEPLHVKVAAGNLAATATA